MTAKATKDRATLIIYLRSGETGYLAIDRQSSASVLGVITPWMREHGIVLGAPQPDLIPTAATPSLIADELAKLAQLRESGVLTDAEFVALKTKLIADHMEGPTAQFARLVVGGGAKRLVARWRGGRQDTHRRSGHGTAGV